MFEKRITSFNLAKKIDHDALQVVSGAKAQTMMLTNYVVPGSGMANDYDIDF